MTIEQEDLLSKLAIAYYRHIKENNIQVYLQRKAEEAGDETRKASHKMEGRQCIAKMEALSEFAEEYLITEYQILKELEVIKEHEKKLDAIIKNTMAYEEERIAELKMNN